MEKFRVLCDLIKILKDIVEISWDFSGTFFLWTGVKTQGL